MSWAAVIIGGMSLVGGLVSSFGSSSAAKKNARAYKQSTQMQLAYLREVRADIARAVDEGLVDVETGYNIAVSELRPTADAGQRALGSYEGLLDDPNAIMDRPSTQFQYGQGMEAMQAASSKISGGGISGSSIKAAIEYGQNFASQALDAELNRLLPIINIGQTATGNIATMAMNKGIVQSNLKLSGSTGSANMGTQVMGNVAANQVSMGQVAANDTINQTNVATSLLSNLANLGYQRYKDPQLFSNKPYSVTRKDGADNALNW